MLLTMKVKQRVEAMHMLRKGQVEILSGDDTRWQSKLVASLFHVAS